MCYCEVKDTVYNTATGQCESKPGTCTSYQDCNKGEYCHFSSACGTTGTCKSASNVQAATGSVTINGTSHRAVCSSTAVNSYYRAEDWCASLGGRLLSSSEVCPMTEQSFSKCADNQTHSELRGQIYSLCHAGIGSDWVWASRPDNSRSSCMMFSFLSLDRSSHGAYEYGQKSDRRGFCLLP